MFPPGSRSPSARLLWVALPMKPVVLFVEDEPNVLQGLRRSLRSLREVWDLQFACGGADAIEMLNARPVDALVTDLRMPGIDGAQVLRHAADRQPECIRIILSGHADENLFFRALGPAHQTLIKPCDTEKLVQVLRRALAVRAMLPMAKLRQFVGRMSKLPAPSETYFRLIEHLDSPLSSARSIGQQIESDVTLTAELLRMANSAYFGRSRTVSNARTAIEVMGTDAVRALLTLSQFYLIPGVRPEVSRRIAQMAHHSFQIGAVARRIAQFEDLPHGMVEDAAAAALLSHVGSAVMMLNHPDIYDRMAQDLDARNLPLGEAERSAFGVTHAEFAAYLLAIWGFSDNAVSSAALHHRPSDCAQYLGTVGDNRVLACVHAAQALAAKFYGPTHFPRQKSPELDLEFLTSIGFETRLDVWAKLCEGKNPD